MMTVGPIDASPTKDLFIFTLVRDVSLQDAVLDLVDNAIDGYVRQGYKERKEIKINITSERFAIWDNCGGIDVDFAQKEVFRFGVTRAGDKKTLGVYGIGLKRSIFKIGSNIIFESDDLKNYFRIKINVNEWKTVPKWEHEFDNVSDSKGDAFTKILITNLYNETSRMFATERFKNELSDRISKTYFLFMQEKVDIYLNDMSIQPIDLEIGFSDQVQPANKSLELDDVKIKLTAGAHPDYKNPGWYVFCNDRLIVLGDRTSLTGWGSRGVPNYHTKFNRFKGFAYIYSDDPAKLPWNTSKNNLDTSSPVYLAMLEEMQTMTQQYTNYMSKAYPTEREETIGKEILGKLETMSTRGITKDQFFKAPDIPTTPQYTNIIYKKPLKVVELVKKCLGNRYMSNRELGELTFDYYKEMECADDE